MQGNGGGSITWGSISTPAITVLKEKGRSIEFCTAISKDRSKIIEFIFVDNMDLSEGKLHISNFIMNEVIKEAQKAIDY